MCWHLASFQGRLIVWTMRRNVRKRELFRLFHRLRLRLSNGPTTYIHYTYLQDKIYDMNIVTAVRVTLVNTSIYLQTMPDTERSRVVWLAESPAQETVGQARLAGPLPSQHHNLPPEHAVQPRLPPLLPFLPEQQLNQVLTPSPPTWNWGGAAWWRVLAQSSLSPRVSWAGLEVETATTEVRVSRNNEGVGGHILSLCWYLQLHFSPDQVTSHSHISHVLSALLNADSYDVFYWQVWGLLIKYRWYIHAKQ